jgi:hypothetical protein
LKSVSTANLNILGPALSNEFTPASRLWIDRILSCFGIAEVERQDCVARGSVLLDGVVMMFLEPIYGARSYLIVRALVGELPPVGQCEALFQMALEVQGNYCGPHVPMLCLDWPSRTLMISTQLDIAVLAADDAGQILVGLHQMALQWREALAKHHGLPVPDAVQTGAVAAG